MRPARLVLFFLVTWFASGIVFSACSNNPRHNYAVASQTVGAALFAIQDAEEAAWNTRKCTELVTTNCITPAAHMGFNQVMVEALRTGKDFNEAVRAWANGSAAPNQLPLIKELLGRLSGLALASFPPDLALEIQKTVALAYDAVLAVILAGGTQ